MPQLKLDTVLRIAQTITTIAFIVTLILVLTNTKSREDSARDSCHLLRGLIAASTPPGQRAKAQAYIARTPLVNCNIYAHDVVTGHISRLPTHHR